MKSFPPFLLITGWRSSGYRWSFHSFHGNLVSIGYAPFHHWSSSVIFFSLETHQQQQLTESDETIRTKLQYYWYCTCQEYSKSWSRDGLWKKKNETSIVKWFELCFLLRMEKGTSLLYRSSFGLTKGILLLHVVRFSKIDLQSRVPVRWVWEGPSHGPKLQITLVNCAQ